MKHLFLALALLPTGHVFAQAERWSEILRTDPYLANGFFIVDQAKYQALGLDHIDVEIIVTTPRINLPPLEQIVQSFTITNGTYGKADLAFLNTMQPDQSSYYKLAGVTAGGTTPIAFTADCTDCEPWPEVCRQTCLSNSYAWAIKAYAFNGEAYMEMADGLVNGSYDYFYVKQADWASFKLQYSPSQLGLTGGTDWNSFFSPPAASTEVFSVDPAPPGARQMDGSLLGAGYTGTAYAIAKRNWPWPVLLTTNELIDNSSTWCDTANGLLTTFNADGGVQYTLGQYGLPPVACQALSFTGGGGVEWGPASTTCVAITVVEQEDENGNVEILDWLYELTTCYTSPFVADLYELSSVTSLYVDPVFGNTPGVHALQVNINGEIDPRLVKVPKTTLAPGLYEFRVVMNDGLVLRHFEEFTTPVVMNSNFKSFVEENIYPVPVTGNRFAVDMDLLTAMQIDFSIVDNTGTPKYTASWTYAQPGRHKEVIEMNPLWNNGLYHAIFQFPDGSSESKQFNIAH